MKKLLWSVALLPLLQGCEGFGKKEKIPLSGDREEVVFGQLNAQGLQIRSMSVSWPAAEKIASWPQESFNTQHHMPHAVLAEAPQSLWSLSVGSGEGTSSRLLNGPVTDTETAYAMDVEGQVTAANLQTGEQLWQVALTPENEYQPFSGGVAYANGVVYAATASAEVIALDAKTGDVRWRTTVTGPVRSAPTVFEGRVFVVTLNNQLIVLEAASGKVQWTHSGMIESAALLGGASVAVQKGVVIVPYSSGEVYALRPENGHELWSASMMSTQRLDGLSAMAHIRANPVIAHHTAYAVSHSGKLAAYDLTSGHEKWTLPLGGTQVPLVMGDFLVVLTADQALACVHKNGQVAWTEALPVYVDEIAKEGRHTWSGPVLAGGALIVISDQGQALRLNPVNGAVLGRFAVPAQVTVPVALAQGKLLVLDGDATLTALQ